MSWIAAVWMMWLSTPASAGDCAEAYTVDGLLGDLVLVEDFLRNGDDGAAASAGKKLESGLACLSELLPAMIAGRSYRAVGAGYVAAGDNERGTAWFKTATEIDQSFDYGLEDVPEDHALRGVYARAKSSSGGEKVAVQDMQWAVGTSYLDGRKLDKPVARLDRPHIYQREDGDVQTWMIEGNAFPAEVLTAAVAVAVAGSAVGKPPKVKEPKAPKVKEPKEPKIKEVKEPKEPKGKEPKSPTSSGDGIIAVARQRPPEKTPLILAGGLVIGGAGAIYIMALKSRAKFDEAESFSEITRLQPVTNRLVIVSAATLAVGAGTFTWGVILDGSAPVPAIKIRF